ncbi:hypothetical protein [Anoxynatronum sibiricum]|uniref:hypothetical protein n=1 Tax=Anoxynatronum sibiricum TaxID=210623 RepID=UPI0031B869A8
MRQDEGWIAIKQRMEAAKSFLPLNLRTPIDNGTKTKDTDETEVLECKQKLEQ